LREKAEPQPAFLSERKGWKGKRKKNRGVSDDDAAFALFLARARKGRGEKREFHTGLTSISNGDARGKKKKKRGGEENVFLNSRSLGREEKKKRKKKKGSPSRAVMTAALTGAFAMRSFKKQEKIWGEGGKGT